MLTRADVAYWRAECAKRCMLGSGEGRGKRAESSVPRLLPILLSTEIPRSGGDDARAEFTCRSHDDLPLSCNTTHQNERSAADPISE